VYWLNYGNTLRNSPKSIIELARLTKFAVIGWTASDLLAN